MANVIGTCSITRTYTGDNIYLSLSLKGADCIFYDGTNVTTTINADNPITITPNLVSQSNSTVTIQSAEWYKDGTLVASSKTGEASEGFSIVKDTYALQITSANFVNAELPQNFVFKVKLSVLCNKFTQTLVHDIIIPMQNSGGSSSYWGSVQLYDGDSNTFTSSQTKIRVKRSLSLGGKQVPLNGYETSWSGLASGDVSETQISGDYSKFITVDRDQVNGQAFLSCTFYVGGQKVEATGITLIDTTDQRIVQCPDQISVAYNGTTEDVTPKLWNASSNNGAGAYETCTNWGVQVLNDINNEPLTKGVDYTWDTSTPSAPVFSMQESNMYYDPSGGSNKTTAFNPIVIFTATIG